MKQGKFIVIEGTDCSGKQTQTEKLIDRLHSEGIDCKHMTFPRYDKPTGKIIGECYLGKNQESWFDDPAHMNPMVASLYYAADRLDAKGGIINTLNQGTSIICDRYVESNMGHQGGKITNLWVRNQFFDKLHDLEYGLLQLPQPDKVVFLYMPYQIGMELKKGREGKADAHEASEDHLRNAEEAYLDLAGKYEWDTIECFTGILPRLPLETPDLKDLRTPEDISEEVYAKVLNLFDA